MKQSTLNTNGQQSKACQQNCCGNIENISESDEVLWGIDVKPSYAIFDFEPKIIEWDSEHDEKTTDD